MRVIPSEFPEIAPPCHHVAVNRCGGVNKIRGDAREIPPLASIRLISGAVSSPGHAIPIYTVVEKGRTPRKKWKE